MKKLLLPVLIIQMLSFNLEAADDNHLGYCSSIEELARNLMTKRQEGVSAAVIYPLAKGNELLVSMINDAFQSPLYSTESYKRESVEEFANKYMAACMVSK